MKTLLPILVIALCVPAGAQELGGAVNGALGQARADAKTTQATVKKGVTHAQRIAALDTTMTAMNDGVEQGGAVVTFVQDQKVEIRFEDQAAPSRIDGKAIVLDWMIAPFPRAIGPRVAWEAAAMMLAEMPECAEKEYMRRSIAARVWLELGGEPAGLPVVEPTTGDKDEALAKDMKLWLDNDNAETALDKIGQATKTPSVQELEAAEKDAAKKAKLFDADARFTRFLAQERDWKLANPR